MDRRWIDVARTKKIHQFCLDSIKFEAKTPKNALSKIKMARTNHCVFYFISIVCATK